MAHLRLVGVIAALAVILCLGLWARSCWTAHKAKLNEKQIQEAKIAIAEHNDEKLKEVFAQADAKQALIDGTVANSEAQTKQVEAESKKKYDAMSAQELQDEAHRRFEESQ
jgi:hypothetical protein